MRTRSFWMSAGGRKIIAMGARAMELLSENALTLDVRTGDNEVDVTRGKLPSEVLVAGTKSGPGGCVLRC